MLGIECNDGTGGEDMSDQTSKSLALSRNKGILGQEVLHVKNGDCIWTLRSIDEKLWGRLSLDQGRSWQDWALLLSDYHGYFSFTVNEGNTIHLTCKNSAGELVYLCWAREKIVYDILGDKWISQERVTFQTILVHDNGIVHLIYFTENPLEQTWKIKYCYKNDTKWSLPELVDYGIGQGQTQGAAALDPDGAIHLIYQIQSSHKFQFAYRERNVNISRWSERTSITDSNRSNLYPCMVIDKKGALHLSWVRSDGMNYRVMYRRKTKGGWMVGGWQRETYLSAPGVNAYTPTIGVLEDEVIALWQQTEGIYQAGSSDEGKTFNDPVLKKQYHKLAYKNLLALDLYKKQGLDTMTTFDTGSTAVALLATVFQNSLDEEGYDPNTSLPEVQHRQQFILPNMEYLSVDYGQKGLEEHLQKINGNFQRLFFETEDVRLTNMQMKETLAEHKETIATLATDLSDKEQQLTKTQQQVEKSKEIIKILKDNIVDVNSKQGMLEKEKQLSEKKAHDLLKLKEEAEDALTKTKPVIQKLEQQVKEKEGQLREIAEKAKQLQRKFDEAIIDKDLLIKQLEETAKNLAARLENLENRSLWKKIFKKNINNI
jgi:hypothetical protein